MNDYQNNGVLRIDSCGFDDLAEALRLVCRWQRRESFESICATQRACTLGFKKWWHNPDFCMNARCLPAPIGIDDGARLMWRWLQGDATLEEWLNSDIQVYQAVGDGQPFTEVVRGDDRFPNDDFFSKPLPLDQKGRAAILVLPRQGINLAPQYGASVVAFPPPPIDNERRWEERRKTTLRPNPNVCGWPFVRGWSLSIGLIDLIDDHGALPSVQPVWMRHGCRRDGVSDSAAYEAAVAEGLAR